MQGGTQEQKALILSISDSSKAPLMQKATPRDDILLHGLWTRPRGGEAVVCPSYEAGEWLAQGDLVTEPATKASSLEPKDNPLSLQSGSIPHV